MSACHCCIEPPLPELRLLGEDDLGFSILGEDPPASPAGLIPAFAGIGLDKAGFVQNDDGSSSAQNASTDSTVAFNAKFISGEDDWSGDTQWVQQRGQRQFFFHPTFSCTFTLAFDESLYDIDVATNFSDDPAPGALLSTTPRSFTCSPPSADGFCVPAGFDDTMAANSFAVNLDQGLIDPAPLTIWPSSDVFVFAVPGLNLMIRLRNIRWSIVPGYTPPEDGSANGFPR